MASRGGGGWVWIPGMLAFTLIVFGGALFYNEEHNPTARPDIAAALATVAAGVETTCTFSPDPAPPRCRVEGDWEEYPQPELFCFCPGTVTTADNNVASRVEVFLGPTENMTINTSVVLEQNWCDSQLAGLTAWPNVITFEAQGDESWSCNVITTRVGEPCSTTNSELYKDLEGNAHCISSMMQGTREHYACLAPIVGHAGNVPCVRDPDGRTLVGTKAQLEVQLSAHQDHFDEQELLMSTISGAMLGSGVVILVLTLLIAAGRMFLGRPEDTRKYSRQGDWSEDLSGDYSDE